MLPVLLSRSDLNHGRSDRDKDAFDLIMRDKERLLSFEEPTQFIFSHSALREGWDNPNVFNICTLNETVSTMKKRQEIGRGVRLPVNQEGERITNLPIKENALTVIANESYAEYVSTLQKEYVNEYGIMAAPPTPANARNRTLVQLKKGYRLNPEFKELWKRISKKTRYAVKVDSSDLAKSCIEQINHITLDTISIRIEKVSLELEDEGVTTRFVGEGSKELVKDFSIPNLVDLISSETNLTRETAFEILSRIKNIDLLFKNPQQFIQSTIIIIKNQLKDFLTNGIKYIELKDQWKMELFENIETYEECIVPVEKSIYDSVIWDSEGEKTFAQQLEEMDQVKLFIKLPYWFSVQTPLGEYNPDWAIVLEERDLSGKVKDKLYLVRETKFVKEMENLRPSETRKIFCAKEHFKTIEVDFKEISGIRELI